MGCVQADVWYREGEDGIDAKVATSGTLVLDSESDSLAGLLLALLLQKYNFYSGTRGADFSASYHRIDRRDQCMSWKWLGRVGLLLKTSLDSERSISHLDRSTGYFITKDHTYCPSWSVICPFIDTNPTTHLFDSYSVFGSYTNGGSPVEALTLSGQEKFERLSLTPFVRMFHTGRTDGMSVLFSSNSPIIIR